MTVGDYVLIPLEVREIGSQRGHDTAHGRRTDVPQSALGDYVPGATSRSGTVSFDIYVVREVVEVGDADRAAIYATAHDRIVRCTTHFGTWYQIDNQQLYNE
jgi:hypothetical protein